MITISTIVAVGTALAVTPAPLHREAGPGLGSAAPAILLDDVPSERVLPSAPSVRLSGPDGCRAELAVPPPACRGEGGDRAGSIRVSVVLAPR